MERSTVKDTAHAVSDTHYNMSRIGSTFTDAASAYVHRQLCQQLSPCRARVAGFP
jgi:hypothetical protein